MFSVFGDCEVLEEVVEEERSERCIAEEEFETRCLFESRSLASSLSESSFLVPELDCASAKSGRSLFSLASRSRSS